MYQLFISSLSFLFRIIPLLFTSKEYIIFENIQLRQQLMAFQAKGERPKNINDVTRSYLVTLMQFWPNWKRALVIVKPETVISWQQKRVKKHWYRLTKSKKKSGRKSKSKEIKELVRRMSAENINWGAPRIYSEILKLGYSEKKFQKELFQDTLKSLDLKTR